MTRTKPQLNRNVIDAVRNVANIDMCMRCPINCSGDDDDVGSLWTSDSTYRNDFHDYDDGDDYAKSEMIIDDDYHLAKYK